MVNFFAPWCIWCRRFEPVYVETASKIPELHFHGHARLACPVFILEGAALTIEPGVTIRAAPADENGAVPTLTAVRGAKLIANGTAELPITFTAITPAIEHEEYVQTDHESTFSNGTVPRWHMGKWGGIVLAGRAPTAHISTPYVEGMPGIAYGGDDPDDSSGILRYVRIWHGGAVLSEGKEINGLTLAGVGRGTVVEHVEVAFSLDDAFEFFGGTVNVRWLSALFMGDDAFDMDWGYTGSAQFLFAVLGASGDHAIEVDGSRHDGVDHTRRTHPRLASLTLVGGGEMGRGEAVARFRGEAAADIAQSVIIGSEHGLQFEACGAISVYGQPLHAANRSGAYGLEMFVDP